MEPLSIWAFTVIAAALGVGLTVMGKAKAGGCCASKPKSDPAVKSAQHQTAPVEKITEVFDAEKEKAIDALIADKN